MGMFDYIKCELPLPDGWRPLGPLQTKDFDCDMVCHVISADGRLMLERIDAVHEVPKSERPFPDAPDDDLRSFCGCIRTERSTHDANFHGVVNFYGIDEEKRWHGYTAKFTDGQLVEIETDLD